MTKRHTKSGQLKTVLNKGRLVCIERNAVSDEGIEGFVVGISDELVMLHNRTEFHLDGYTVIFTGDVKSWYILDEDDDIAERVLNAKGIEPIVPDAVSLASLPELLLSVDREYPLTVIYRERSDPDSFLLGRIVKLTDKTVTLQLVEPDAQWGDQLRVRLKDITRIEFDREYDKGLWMIDR